MYLNVNEVVENNFNGVKEVTLNENFVQVPVLEIIPLLREYVSKSLTIRIRSGTLHKFYIYGSGGGPYD